MRVRKSALWRKYNCIPNKYKYNRQTWKIPGTHGPVEPCLPTHMAIFLTNQNTAWKQVSGWSAWFLSYIYVVVFPRLSSFEFWLWTCGHQEVLLFLFLTERHGHLKIVDQFSMWRGHPLGFWLHSNLTPQDLVSI